MKTRRSFLMSVASSALIVPSTVNAIVATSAQSQADRNKSPYRVERPARVLTTLKFSNTSENHIEPDSVTQLIGCPFRKGDIPAGSWPQFQLQDGTPVPCTLLSTLAATWSDGSLKFVPAMLQIPVSVGGHQHIIIRVLSGGWLCQSSPRNLNDFQQGISPQIQVDGLDNLSGTWIFSLAQGISDEIKIVEYGNGPAGAVWKVRARAQQNGKSHKQLLCDFYVASLANADGSLKGLRILGKIKLPYYDSKTTMSWVSFSRFQLCVNDDRKVIRDCFGKEFGKDRAYQFAWVSGPNFAANHGYSTANYGDYGYCTRLSTTGTLPAGLTSERSYFTGSVSATTIGFATNSAVPSAHLVNASDGGSGTHTATPFPYLAYFGALFTASPEGTWDFVQGMGTDKVDTTLHCKINKKYWVSTGLIPSYDISIRPTNNQPTSYWPNCSEPVTRYLGTTGERDDIGILPAWYARHFLTQSVVDERVVRVASLVGGHFSIGVENSHTLTLPCVNNGSRGDGRGYRGMPAPNSQFRWTADGSRGVGFPYADTTDPNVQIAGFSQQDSSHMAQFNYYPYLLTGEPWHLDMLLEHANNAVYQRYSVLGTANISRTSYDLGSGARNLQVPPNPPTYGNTIGNGQQRTDAWASALLVAAAGICPDTNPDCKSYKEYFSDLNCSTWTAALNIYKALPPYAKRYGLWHVISGGKWQFTIHWQMAYLGSTLSLAVSSTENKKAIILLNSLVRWFDHVVAEFGGWHVGSYMTLIKSSSAAGGPLVTSDDGVAFCGPNIKWNSNGHFTFSAYSNYSPANGDKIVFSEPGTGTDQVTPAGFVNYTPYYVINLSGSQFDLSAFPGGSPIPLSDSYAGSDEFFIISSKPPAVGSMAAINSTYGYNTEILGMLNYALAAGATVEPATVADLAYRNQQAGINFTADPCWAMKNTFLQ